MVERHHPERIHCVARHGILAAGALPKLTRVKILNTAFRITHSFVGQVAKGNEMKDIAYLEVDRSSASNLIAIGRSNDVLLALGIAANAGRSVTNGRRL